MKKAIMFILPICLAVLAFTAKPKVETKVYQDDNQINWLTLDEAVAKNEAEPKMLFIDFYTDWCKWCKQMDDNVFANKLIAEKINENFYPVKFNGDMKEPITFNGVTYTFNDTLTRPMHGLVVELATINDRRGYPSYVFLDEGLGKVKAVQGYKTVDRLNQLLEYYGDPEIYQNKNWIEFVQEQAGK